MLSRSVQHALLDSRLSTIVVDTSTPLTTLLTLTYTSLYSMFIL